MEKRIELERRGKTPDQVKKRKKKKKKEQFENEGRKRGKSRPLVGLQ
jgi:hypothetical protein